MAVFDLYSKRLKRLQGEVSDIYEYDSLPEPFRIQVIHIITRIFDNHTGFNIQPYNIITNILRQEYGVLKLKSNHGAYSDSTKKELLGFFLETDAIEKALDIIELAFSLINSKYRQKIYNFDKIADESIDDLNTRFQENSIGYKFESGHIIRVDSEYIHSEIVKPALKLLNGSCFTGAQQEFLNAHEHYKKGKYKECSNECLKAFESTMKSICHNKSWPYKQTATARELIDICLQNKLIPDFWQSHFSSLRALLEGSIPTGRNKLSGHGQGKTATAIPAYLASYMLHMTASTIVFLAEAEKA